MTQERKYKSFNEFYPFYLSEHQNTTSRRLHFIGTGIVVLIIPAAVLFHKASLLLLIPVVGYGFAWVGHFFFEKNKPATFQYPLWSLGSDFKLFFQILAGKEKL
ncbi:DUF962 domain-containing protein [Solitalea longa]|uniref:DUF962 domain-containing protein n=1 Tax=Solitalea longa TaxID=2079460 RepID=A0A2S4ZYJ8_9SPHI|nr:DUF962 domain-containing protein [Solitalea longa]POY35424.1 DUF962 domain-containing protein [Solitalea longa]